MREILFKGKRKDTREWVYGLPCYIYDNGKTILCVTVYEDKEKSATFSRTYEILPETLSQYTGMKDRDGEKIFENDIVEDTMKYDVSGNVKEIGEIRFSESYGIFSILFQNGGRCERMLGTEHFKCKIIGNVFDDPEVQK